MTFYSALHYAAKAEKYASEASVHNLGNKLTNCITEIPQDIKLELNNGTLILKAGSKAYVPNGVGKFDTITTTKDISLSASSSVTRFLFIASSESCDYIQPHYCYSGSTAPTGISGTAYWYDTTNNLMKTTTNSGSTWNTVTKSLPIAIFTTTSGKITSIDQVFNGFGYIGSHRFYLPGVKGLVPNGRNADGSLKNTEVTIQKVVMRTDGTNSGSLIDCYNPSATGIGSTSPSAFIESPNKPSLTNGYWIDTINNIFYNVVNGVFNPVLRLPLATVSLENSRITSFTPKLPFRAADDQEVVKTSGNQTIGGSKIFTSSINIRDTEYDRLTNPSADRNETLVWEDKNGYDLGYINQKITTDGTNTLTFTASTYKTDGTRVTGAMSVTAKRDGTVYTYAPTPAAADNSTKIATTAWVMKKLVPNYATRTNIANKATVTMPSDALVIAHFGNHSNNYGYLKVNDVTVFTAYVSPGYQSDTRGTVYVKKGDKVYWESADTPKQGCYYYPI